MVDKGDVETFMEQQEDINGNALKNEIDTRESLRSQNSYKGEGYGAINKGGGEILFLGGLNIGTGGF